MCLARFVRPCPKSLAQGFTPGTQALPRGTLAKPGRGSQGLLRPQGIEARGFLNGSATAPKGQEANALAWVTCQCYTEFHHVSCEGGRDKTGYPGGKPG